jgi:hypothetical protein
MTKTFEPSSPQVPLRFGSQSRLRAMWDHNSDYFGIYSCRFSADGNEVIAGGNGQQGELRGKEFGVPVRYVISCLSFVGNPSVRPARGSQNDQDRRTRGRREQLLLG